MARGTVARKNKKAPPERNASRRGNGWNFDFQKIACVAPPVQTGDHRGVMRLPRPLGAWESVAAFPFVNRAWRYAASLGDLGEPNGFDDRCDVHASILTIG